MKPELILFMAIGIIQLITLSYIMLSDNTMQTYGRFENNNVTGLNIPNCGYFIYTKDRNWQDIQLTDTHEEIHEMIRQDSKCGDISCREHFCG